MTAVLNVLLLILKWLGILLLVILGILLLLVVLVLVVPVRYKGTLTKKEAPEEVFRADGLVSWLNPLLRVRIRYAGKKLCYTVRLLGLCLFDSEKPKKEKGKKEKPKQTKKRKPRKHSKESRKKEEAGQKPAPEQVTTEQTAEKESSEDTTEVSKPVAELYSEGGQSVAEPEAISGQEEERKKKSFFAKIKSFVEKIKAIPDKIKQKATRFVNTLKLLWYKKEKVVVFFEDELHRTALGTSWKAVKRLLHHILPGKIKGYAEFGTGDPESTGKALGVLGVLYAAYGKGLTIVPDFYEKRMVAELTLKGRIRCGTVLVICLKLIRDKQVKRLYHNWKKLLKLLKQKAE